MTFMANKGPRYKRTWIPLLLGTGMVLAMGGLLLQGGYSTDQRWFNIGVPLVLLVSGVWQLIDGVIQWKRYGWNARAEPDGRSSIWNL